MKSRNNRSVVLRCFFLSVCLSACVGGIAPPEHQPGTGGTNPTQTGTPNQPDTTVPPSAIPAKCQVPQAAVLPARLLSPSQYANSVKDVLQMGGDIAKGFTGGGFSRLDESELEKRATAAADVALAAATTLSAWAPCAPAAATDSGCAQQIIDRIGAKAFRRPLTAEDRAQMKALFDAGAKEKDFATGVQWFLTGLLQAPDFLYLFVRSTPNETAGKVVPIAAHDVASRLAYFVWDSPPDDRLMAAADAGKLTDAAELRAEVNRMLGDDRFARGVSSFYSGWLNLNGFAEVARDGQDFTGAVASSLATSLLMSATQIYASPSPTLSALFSGDSYPLDRALRTFYGRPGGTSDAFAMVRMDGEGRRGIVTHPGLMTLLSHPGESNPISRGLFVRRTLLCQAVPAPPPGLTIPPLPPVADGLSTRDRLDQHTKDPVCQACHRLIDPPGFALEGFDHVGRARTVEQGRPVDTSGDLTEGADVGGPFANGEALLARMADSREVRSCFAKSYFQHALAGVIAAADECSADGVREAFAKTGDLKQLVVSIVTADSFRLRLTEGVAP